MQLHANAALTLNQRRWVAREIVERGRPVAEVAEATGASGRTCSKWAGRYQAEGEAGLRDRSSAPRSVPNRTPADRVEAIVLLRGLRFSGPQIAELLDMPDSTVSAILKREGHGRLGRLGLEPAQRYERDRPGELVHIDIKKLAGIGPKGAGHRMTGSRRGQSRYHGPGYRYVHVAVDDATRLAYVEVLDNEQARTAIAFLRRAVAFFGRYGIRVEQVLTDNGPAYKSKLHAIACRALGIRHSRTRPRRPQTNGKAERFIRTLLEGWAYGAIYGSTRERDGALDGWLWHYNHRRRHSALGRKTPSTRLTELNNPPGTYS
jgi:transposase InsO family protein